MSRLSIIIPTKDRKNDLIKCLTSISHQSIKPEEIIIVDASNNINNYRNYVKKNIKLTHIPAIKTGSSSQRNQGLEIAYQKSKYVMLLDDDVILESNFCENILKTFDLQDGIVGVGGAISNYSISFIDNLLLKIFLMRGKGDGKFLPSGYATVPTLSKLKTPVEADFLSGGLSCYRLSAIKGLWFDTKYEEITGHAYCEDLDFSYRVSKRGKLIITPYARAIHKESPAARPDEFSHGIAQVVNRARLVKKIWGNRPYHWTCFCWAIFGQIILNLAATTRGRSIKRVMGNIAGLKLVLQRFKDI